MGMAKETYKNKIIMRKIFILILIQITLISCKTISQNNNKMEKIDLTKFKNKKLALNIIYKEEVKDTIIEYGVFKDKIIKNIIIKGSPYHTKKPTIKATTKLKPSLTIFIEYLLEFQKNMMKLVIF